MADPELVEILRQGSEVWNRWREQQPADLQIDLRGARLSRADLRGMDLHEANLYNANLGDTNLSGADLSRVNLNLADLSNASLIHTILSEASLVRTILSGADLSAADLHEANLHEADLSATDLSGAILSGTHLDGAHLWGTVFAYLDLRQTKGLLELIHNAPSRIELYTVQLPQGNTARHFLRGVGVPDEWIKDYYTHMMDHIQYYSCVIGYAHQDEILAKHLYTDLQNHNVRCWFAPEDIKIGDKIRSRIDEAIHLHEKLLLLLSEHALASDWVEDEVETALEKEKR